MRLRPPFLPALVASLALASVSLAAPRAPSPVERQLIKNRRPEKLPETPGSEAPALAKAARPLTIPIQRATLENGLRVVMNPDHSSPTVAVAMTYDVGARNEDPGRSGFAHLFEHMMFQGSANVPKGDHFKLITAHGGTLNGTTSSDRTNYFQVLPSSELALALWLEADRMKSLDISLENFENQRKVVQEEYRMRVSNSAYAEARIRLSELAYQGYWPYEHPPIGSMKDLDDAKLEWVRAFHHSHYAPNLAVLSISGDFEPDEAMQLVHRFFDTAKKQESPIAYKPPPLPEQTSPRTDVLEDANAKTPAFFYGWVIPPMRDPAHYPLELLSSVLADGESSRLYRKLVRERGVAADVWAGTGDRRGPDLFTIFVKLREGAKLEDVQKLVDAEIEALARSGPTEAEMKKVASRTEAYFLFGLQSNLQRAIRLGEAEAFWGDARLLTQEPLRYASVTRSDIQRAASEWLVPEKRTLIEVLPKGMSRATPAARETSSKAAVMRRSPRANEKALKSPPRPSKPKRR